MIEPRIRIVRAAELDPILHRAIVDLCSRAYRESFAPYLANLQRPTHVLAYDGGALAAHACWMARWLQPRDGPLLRTAYVEAVATEPAAQRRGLATATLRALVRQVQDFDLAALSPSDPGFYARRGWQVWRGPLLARTAHGLLAMPDEMAMILPLPRTPPLDLDAPLSIEWRPGEIW